VASLTNKAMFASTIRELSTESVIIASKFQTFGFQVANTWTKITARYGYAIGRNGKERENPNISSAAATFEKAIT
jgi:hypothetical protein